MELIKSHWGISLIVGLVVFLLLGATVISQTKKVSPLAWNWFGPVNAAHGVAIGGYDPVAYHTTSKSEPGTEEFSTNWGGAEWRFVSNENMALFKAAPVKYAPKYGGFCSFAASKGFTAEGDPNIWRLEDEQLFLFADEGPRKTWASEIDDGVIARGDEKWGARSAKYD